MQLWIDNKSGIPIYDQIYTKLKEQILNGTLKANEMLPSIRGLAKDLRISVITTKRAYEELEKEGLLYTVAAKGSFVAPQDTEWIREENLKKLEDHLAQAVKLAAVCQLSKDELTKMLFYEMEENR